MRGGRGGIFGPMRRLVLLALFSEAAAGRAPDKADAAIPSRELWCADPALGTPTRTTGECICKYACVGPRCVNQQGFMFYSWKDGVSGAAKCGPPPNFSQEEKLELASKRTEQRKRLAAERSESMGKAEEAQAAAETRRALESSAALQPITWSEWLEDLEWANVAAAVVASLFIGTVLVVMVAASLKDAVATVTAPPAASAPAAPAAPAAAAAAAASEKDGGVDNHTHRRKRDD